MSRPVPAAAAFAVWCPPPQQAVLTALLGPVCPGLVMRDLTDLPAAGDGAGDGEEGLILYPSLAMALAAALARGDGDLAAAAAVWQAQLAPLPDLVAAHPGLRLVGAAAAELAGPGLVALCAPAGAAQIGRAELATGAEPVTPPDDGRLPLPDPSGAELPVLLPVLLAALLAQACPDLGALAVRLAAAETPLPGYRPAASDPAALRALLRRAGRAAPQATAPQVLDRVFRQSQAQLAAQTAALAARDAALAALAQDMARRDAALMQAADQALRGQDEVRALRASHSWRVTAPLRAASLLARRLRPGRG